MNENFNELIEKFKNINKLGYIKGINNNLLNSAGLTLENLLNKKADSTFFPDYKNIEIKCTQRFSRYPIGLFSISFDGPNLFESNYLLDNYGKKDKQFKDKKTLILNLKYNEKVLFNNTYYFELKIDEKKIYVNIYDSNSKFLESRGFIDFESLEKRINTKLNNLALIFASKRKICNDLYFRYYKIKCYNIKDFETFINLIKSNDINLTLMMRFARSGKNIGKNKSKNMTFQIKKNSISKLFDELFTWKN